MYDRITVGLWMMLTQPQRQHLAKVFGIPHSGISEIRDQTVLTDGHTGEDLQAITTEKMELYVGSKEAFSRLWELTVAKCHYELNPPIGTIKGSSVEASFEDTLKDLADEPLATKEYVDIINVNTDSAAKPTKHAKKAKSK